ncbi:melanoma antigen preferentially expressed in tumors [Ctenodactylus gundi]
MSMWDPPRLLELATKSLLRNEALAVAALEMLPVELFPSLLMKAYAGKCHKTLKAMKVRQKKGLLHLCCKKFAIFEEPMQNIKMILKKIHLDSIQTLEVSCSWKLSALGSFAPHLGQMVNLRRLDFSHIRKSFYIYTKKKKYVNTFVSQFLNLHYLQELYLDSVSFFKGCLHVVLR